MIVPKIQKSQKANKNGISQLKKPVAIAMWDFSWLLRHHRMGEFENWDKVLDELVERGYDAIRIDCFPHLIAANNQGIVDEEFFCPKEDWTPALWGNQYSVSIRPRQALLEFLPKCREKGIRVGLATWFSGHGTGRNTLFEDEEGLVRAWDETLRFLDDNNLLKDVLYVDVLNEYPLNHGFNWLHKAMLADERKVGINDIQMETVGNEHIWSPDRGSFRTDYHLGFLNRVIDKISDRWPEVDLFASLTPYDDDLRWSSMADISKFAALDMHLWFVLGKAFNKATNYWEYILPFKNDVQFSKGYSLIRTYWKENRQKSIDWMKKQICLVESTAKNLNIPYGNTEGWGAIAWNDHPELDWEFIKDSAEICARLGAEHGYMFNCSSNFTHPQFPGIWHDVQWHKKVTSIIKEG
jgi:hypothetical protein